MCYSRYRSAVSTPLSPTFSNRTIPFTHVSSLVLFFTLTRDVLVTPEGERTALVNAAVPLNDGGEALVGENVSSVRGGRRASRAATAEISDRDRVDWEMEMQRLNTRPPEAVLYERRSTAHYNDTDDGSTAGHDMDRAAHPIDISWF